MRRVPLIIFVFVTCGRGAFGQDPAPAEPKSTTVVMARWVARVETGGINNYHFVEVFQVRRKWIYPDIVKLIHVRE